MSAQPNRTGWIIIAVGSVLAVCVCLVFTGAGGLFLIATGDATLKNLATPSASPVTISPPRNIKHFETAEYSFDYPGI